VSAFTDRVYRAWIGRPVRNERGQWLADALALGARLRAGGMGAVAPMVTMGGVPEHPTEAGEPSGAVVTESECAVDQFRGFAARRSLPNQGGRVAA
jgi:hypothetical protein